MILALGCLAGIGMVLAFSPLLWPERAARARVPRRIGRLAGLLAAAGLARVSPVAFVFVCVIAGLLTGAVAQALLGITAVGVAAAIAGAGMPFAVLASRRRTRLRANRSAWPDTVDQLVAGVRSGLGLPEAVAALAETGPVGLRAAFAAFARDYRATGTFAPAAARLRGALADPVADRVIATLTMAREVGGSELVPVLKALSASLREDTATRSEAEARQSWTVGAARLGVAAPWIVLLLLSTRPEARAAYNTPGGIAIIVCGLVVSLIAYRLMLAVGRLPEEKRWFR